MAFTKKYSLLFVLLLSGFVSSAQSFLSLDSAIAIVLKKNYNILIAQNNYQIVSNNHAPGEAGMLPDISLNAGYSSSNNTINQQYSTGLELNKSGVVSSTLAPNLGLTWTLFDGTKMFIAYNQLGLLKDEGMLYVKEAMQDNIAAVIQAYYNIVQQKELLMVLDSNMALYKEEMNIADEQYKIGTGSKLNYLQAEVSYNIQRSAYFRQQVSITNAIVQLNQLIELPVEASYKVGDSIPMNRALIYDSLKKNMAAQNPSLMLSQTNIKVAENSLKEVDAMRLPTLNLGLSYGLSRTQSNAGFALLNQSQGLSGGLIFGWTIFNGSIINIQHKNAEINELNAKLNFSQAQLQENAALLIAFQQYEDNIKILKMDEDNFIIAKENVYVALEQFRIGTSNIVQLQQAQISFASAGSQVATDRYNAKVSETQLLQLSAQLVK
ncbi:MAG TPA: TolC family protein [Bacteroidia bacterium]|nr:TolC family protein [Bacteroidia bacterium]